MKRLLLILAMVLAFSAQAETIGVLNHNPGNISTLNVKAWDGAIGIDGWQHLRFQSAIYGISAIGINLKFYKEKHGIKTVTGLVARWIPKKDTAEQHLEYVRCICKRMGGIDPFQKLDFNDPCTQKNLAKAIIFYENGYDPYSQKTYSRAFGRCAN